MDSAPKPSDLYQRNINVLIGAGASAGAFPTLALKIKPPEGGWATIESLGEWLLSKDRKNDYAALFFFYYKKIIEEVLEADYDILDILSGITSEYKTLLKNLLTLLNRKGAGQDKRCNIFTSNYDGFLEHAADELQIELPQNFYVNDGTRGFKQRVLSARNYSQTLTETGVFGRHSVEIPQVNLIHLHGSVYWYSRKDEEILVDYWKGLQGRKITNDLSDICADFFLKLEDENSTFEDLPQVALSPEQVSQFWKEYKLLPIVNPTKWKFHETVLEEHYYQMLRHLSYELERPNAVLLVFGFSFADEHIRNLIKRSLSNPNLQIFVYCYSQRAAEFIKATFSKFPNVVPVTNGDLNLTFKEFNGSLSGSVKDEPGAPA